MAVHSDAADSILQNIIQSTRQLIDNEDPWGFVSTYASREALKMLNRFGSILIKGISGSGKSRLGLKLLQDLRQTGNRIPIVLTSSRQWHLIPKRPPMRERESDDEQHLNKYVVLIDNIFGSSSLVETWVEEWSRMFNIIYPYVESGQIFLIITSRPEIICQCEHRLKKLTLFENIHCVSLYTGDYELRRYEKRNIVKKCCKRVSFKEKELEELLDIDTSIGLPQCCKFYARSREAQAKGLQFFYKPFDYVAKEVAILEETDPLGYLVLLLLVTNSGCLESKIFRTLHTTHFKDLVETLGEMCSLSSMPSLQRIKTKAEALCGVFLDQVQGNFQFCHQTVFDAVFLDLASRFPEICVQVCSARLLVELVRTQDHKSETKEVSVILPKSDYCILADRMTHLILSGSCLEVLDHPSLHHVEFVEILFDSLKKKNKLNEVVSAELPEERQLQAFSAIDDIMNENPQPYQAIFVLFYYRNILSYMILKHIRLFPFILDELGHTMSPELLQQLLHCSVYVNNKMLCQKLIDLGAVPDENCVRSLCASPYLQEDTPELNKLILGNHFQWHQMSDIIENLFCLAVEKGNTSLVEILGEKMDQGYFNFRSDGMLISLLQMFWAANFNRCTRTTDAVVENAIEILLASGCETDMSYLAWLASCHLNTVALNVILKRDVDVNMRYHGKTSLHQAVQFGGAQCVVMLLENGADISMIEEVGGNTVLHIAAETLTESGSKTNILCEKLGHMIQEGTTRSIQDPQLGLNEISCMKVRDFVNKRNYAWNTPLHVASRSGDTDSLKNLIHAGADVNVRNLKGDTPLHLAADYEATESVKHLVHEKASVHMTNVWGDTPLTVVHSTHFDIVDILIDSGSNINWANGHQGSCLHMAVISGDVKTMEHLCRKGADVNVTNRHGQSCLMMASTHGDLDMIKYLCKQGAQTDVTDDYGQTVIHTALMLETDTVEKVQYLLDVQHAPVDVKDKHGRTAMFPAVESGDPEVVQLLKDRGFDVQQVDQNGNTLLHAACESKSKNIDDLLKILLPGNKDAVDEQTSTNQSARRINCKNESGETVLSLIAKNDLDCDMQFVLDRGADPNISDHQGGTPLHYMAENGKVGRIKSLLAAGADPCVADSNGKTPLHLAAYSGDENSVMLLLLNGADPHTIDSHGKSPLHIAAGNRNSKNVYQLLDKGADVNQLDDQGQTSLLIAAVGGHSESMKLLLEKGAEPCTSDKGKRTALHIVCTKKNSKDDILFLLKKGADPSASDQNGRTPLHFAAESGNTGCIDVLIRKGVDLCSVDNRGLTALHVAAENGQCNFVKIVIDKGADVDVTDRKGKSALHFAAESGNNDCVILLLELGANPNKSDIAGRIPLQLALQREDGSRFQEISSVKLLIDKVSNPSLTDRFGKSLLHVAAGRQVRGNEYVRHLLERGADPRIKDGEGKTPLHMASLSGCTESIKLLLDAGADPNIFDCHMRTPLLIASKRTKSDFVKVLLEAGADPDVCNKEGKTPLHYASNVGSSISVKLLVDKGASLSASDENGWTPLHFAGKRATKDITALLLQNGAVTNAQNKQGQTSLHIAAESKVSNIIKLLLGFGANPNIFDTEGQSPLHIAVSNENTENVKILLQKGAAPSLFDHNRKTPLHLAAEKTTSDNVKLLLQKGADSCSRDEQGRTPLHIASETGNDESVELLLCSGADPRLKDSEGKTPLHLTLAAISDTEELVPRQAHYLSTLTSLVQHGSDPSVKDLEGISPTDMLQSMKDSRHGSQDSQLSKRYLHNEERYIGIMDKADIVLGRRYYYEEKVSMGEFVQWVTDILHGQE